MQPLALGFWLLAFGGLIVGYFFLVHLSCVTAILGGAFVWHKAIHVP
jgi:hypothetical protein